MMFIHNIKVLPCAFCGSRPEMKIAQGNSACRILKCSGSKCPASLMGMHGSISPSDSIKNEQEAVRKWNTRHVGSSFTN